MKKYEELARFLEDSAAYPEHNEAAKVLRHLGRVYEVAYEVVHAKNSDYQRAAYAELIDLIKGKQNGD